LVRRIHYVLVLTIALIGLASFPVAAQSGRTFYIDYASGSNSNNGTSNSAPWKTHPYMQTSAACTGTGSAPAYSHQAGDRFIFKGGVTWPAACFGMNVAAGGSSSSMTDYYGVDTTWFTGGSFTRPVFDLANTIPVSTGFSGGTSFSVIMVKAANVTFDNIEIKRQFIHSAGHIGPNSGYDCGIYFDGFSGAQGGLVKNGFFHDWVSDTANISAGWSNCAGGIGQNGGSSSYNVDRTTVSGQNSMDLTRGVQVSFGGCFQNATEVKNSFCDHAGQGAVGFGSVHDSQFDHLSNAGAISPYTNGLHTNVIHDTFPGGGRLVYNNIMFNNAVGEVVGMCPTTDVYNNVMWNNSGAGADILIDTGVNACTVNTSTVANVYNNSVDCSNGQSCLRVIRAGVTIGTVNVKNNHWITNSSPVSIELAIAALNQSNNITMSSSAAASQGYTVSNNLMPTSSSAQTVNSALNLASLCIGNLSAFCFDRLHAPRLSSWDAGAYQFGSQSSSKPNPPSGLSAVVQ